LSLVFTGYTHAGAALPEGLAADAEAAGQLGFGHVALVFQDEAAEVVVEAEIR
jgi:hypothetical protein